MDLVALAVIVFYLLLTSVVGALLARRSAGSDQWAAGGGQMGVLMVAVGIAGTRIGGVGTYGVAGDVITSGIWNFWYGVNTLLALALVGFFFAVPYRRLRLHTVAEIFWVRFRSRRCQVLTSLCVQTEYLIVNILEPFVIASILVGVTGMPFGAAVYIGALVLISYTSLGGPRRRTTSTPSSTATRSALSPSRPLAVFAPGPAPKTALMRPARSLRHPVSPLAEPLPLGACVGG